MPDDYNGMKIFEKKLPDDLYVAAKIEWKIYFPRCNLDVKFKKMFRISSSDTYYCAAVQKSLHKGYHA